MAGELKVNLILEIENAKSQVRSFFSSFGKFNLSNKFNIMADFEKSLQKGEKDLDKFWRNAVRIGKSQKFVPQELSDALKSKGANVHIAGDNPNAAANRAAYEASRNMMLTGSGLASEPPSDILSGKKRTREEQIKYDAMEAKRYDQLQADAQKAFRSKVMFFKDLTFLFHPLLNPTSVWGNMFAARQTFSAFSTEEGQRRIGGGGAMGALRATALLQGAALAVGLALKGLRTALEFAADEIKKAFQFAHQLYGQSLTSGLSLSFMAQRQMTASVLGVDETQIFRFRQSTQVMKQLSGAVSEISKDAPRLAYTTAQFKILEFNALALGAKIGNELTPALNGLAIVLQKIIDVLNNSAIEKILKISVQSILSAVPGGALANMTGSILAKIGIRNDASHTFGQPQSYLKQLPVGAFEKMGLIIGGGMADKALEYQRRTATAVEKIYQAAYAKTQKTTGFYMGRNPFVAGH